MVRSAAQTTKNLPDYVLCTSRIVPNSTCGNSFLPSIYYYKHLDKRGFPNRPDVPETNHECPHWPRHRVTEPSTPQTSPAAPVMPTLVHARLLSATAPPGEDNQESDSSMADAARHRLTVPSGADPLAAARKSVAAVTGSGSQPRPSQYLARLADFRQMDLQSALDQMKTLLSTRPHVVYKTSYYRKQTKNHWARDDPAFVALQFVFLVVSSIAYSVSFRASVGEGTAFIFYSILFHWLASGFILATIGREIANRHLTDHKSSSHVRQTVEWLYAFDIHCNAFFPVFVLLCKWLQREDAYTTNNELLTVQVTNSVAFSPVADVIQFFLLPLVLGTSLFALIISNTLYAAAFSWYWYITHLGYRALPFLSQTEVFLFPVAAIVIVYALNLIGFMFGLGWNASRVMAHIYFD